MKLPKIMTALLFSFALMLTACGPKDADISKNVSDNLAQVAPGVTASVTDGVVTLNGQVSDEATKAAAEDAAKKTKGVKSVVDNITIAAPVPTVSADDELRKGVADATKDFPGATATVNDGEIMVTGELTKDQWTRLKMSLDALNPKKVTATGLKIK